MSTIGDLSLLNDPVAQTLLTSTHLARLAYIWDDGTPRVVPICFHWNGQEVIIVSPAGAPKLSVLTNNSKVALTIDSEPWPAKVLLIRGSVALTVVDGLAPEYVLAAKRYLGEEGGAGFVAQVGGLLKQTGRIAITPEW